MNQVHFQKSKQFICVLLLCGLAYKEFGKSSLAKEDLQKAVELSVGNLRANSELKEL